MRHKNHLTLCFLLSLICALLPRYGFGADWKFYFENRAGVRFYIDSASIVHLANGNVRAWQKQEWKAPDAQLGGETGYLWLLEMNCHERRYIYRAITPIRGTIQGYQEGNELYKVYADDWTFLQPNDLDKATYTTWCNRLPATIK
jgi:hypothetical protein